MATLEDRAPPPARLETLPEGLLLGPRGDAPRVQLPPFKNTVVRRRPAVFIEILAATQMAGRFSKPNISVLPGGVPPLGLYLAYAHGLGSISKRHSLPPFDGSYLAISPDNSETRAMVNRMLNGSRIKEMLDFVQTRPNISKDIDRVLAKEKLSLKQVSAF